MPCSEDSKALSIVNLSQFHRDISFNPIGNAVQVLNNINMSIEAGQIYTLLGPSGCGKTSLLRCILGLDKPTHGTIKIFGSRPGQFHSNPSAGIGYMPQTSCLFQNLSVRENMYLFASFYHMKNPARQVEGLIQSMDLPGHRLVCKLSGGQKRRLSLAITIIHEPPFIILDEPTVGIDPLLQKTIWANLVSMARSKNISILFTTHYIEEAHHSDVVGFLSADGQFIIQDSIPALQRRYGVRNLTQLFHTVYDEHMTQAHALSQITVGHNDGSEDTTSSSGISETSLVIHRTSSPITQRKLGLDEAESNRIQIDLHFWASGIFLKMWYLIRKNIFSFARNPFYILFQLAIPTVQIILFLSCIGGHLNHLPISVYNGDVNNLTVSFLDSINNQTLVLTHFMTEAEAIESVKLGHSAAAISIPANYTEGLTERLFSVVSYEPVVTKQPPIVLYPDMSNLLVSLTAANELNMAFQRVGGKHLSAMDLNPSILELPVEVGEPIYGHKDSMFRDFMCPGVMLSIIFLASISLSAVSLVSQRKEGLFERCLCAGVPVSFLLLSELLSHSIIAIFQVIAVLVSVFGFFQFPVASPMVLFNIAALALSQAVCGIGFGLFIASISKNEIAALMFGLGFFYPNLLLSGTVWPIESMPKTFQSLTQFMPQTQAIFSLRCMIFRGWTWDYAEVLDGFISTATHTAIFCIIACIVFKCYKV